MRGSKVMATDDSGPGTAAYSNAIYEDIPSRPPSLYPSNRTSYLTPSDKKPIKEVHFERGNPLFESDMEEEVLEGAVGGVPFSDKPPPYSEKDAQIAHIMSHVKDNDGDKKLPVDDEDGDGYLEAGNKPPAYSINRHVVQVQMANGDLPEKPPIDVLY